jgi:hypothetical protein
LCAQLLTDWNGAITRDPDPIHGGALILSANRVTRGLAFRA